MSRLYFSVFASVIIFTRAFSFAVTRPAPKGENQIKSHDLFSYLFREKVNNDMLFNFV